tara:strand:- start:8017 stop:9147 length:1131 start_codon:yes stop_codon:yes gene_type:complete
MKIGYIIYTAGHGRGGHFYSLKTIKEEVPLNSHILNIGVNKSPVLENDTQYTFIDLKDGWIKAIQRMRKIIISENLTHLHSFDYHSLIISSCFSWFLQLPHIHTKPGGPTPRRHFLRTKYLSVFTLEDFKFFLTAKHSHIKVLELITNRVNNFELSRDLQLDHENFLKNKIVLMRVARISKSYQNSILQTIKLAMELKELGHKICILLIGVVECQEAYKLIKSKVQTNDILILTDDYYTINAKRLLSYADIVLGAGRSFMEGVFSGAIVLSPTVDSDMPELIDQSNYEAFKESNFTGRNIKTNGSNVIEKLEILLSSKSERENYSNFLKDVYIKDFCIKEGVKKYIKLYNRCNEPNGVIDTAINFLHFLVKIIMSR